ncbi:ACT domain repeat 4 [Striga asiatica]|uniref:ACT domain-containing protein ACR n=1 Tax=Striga asiatica TaxID=4170 RepID=A0A5A7QF27_STRAF|nr:ACT domain repeat 4 [Striga asiatica]
MNRKFEALRKFEGAAEIEIPITGPLYIYTPSPHFCTEWEVQVRVFISRFKEETLSKSCNSNNLSLNFGRLCCVEGIKGNLEASVSYSGSMDDEYEKLIRRMHPPRVVIDNDSCKNATVVQSLGPDSCFASSRRRSVGLTAGGDHTSIELIGADRPGLLSEVSAVLTHLKCNVVSAEVWTHNTRAASVMRVTDELSGGPIHDPDRLATIRRLLCNVVKGSNKSRDAKTAVSCGVTHTERRLHQMMFDDRDYDRIDEDYDDGEGLGREIIRPMVNVVNWEDKDYSVVTVRCKDRPKLLFDIVCTLTDMQYVVFHGNVDTEGLQAYQEYCIRHIDGSPVKSDAERQRVIQCLEAAIQRRVSEGLKLELCTTDRVGLLSDVTRIFRESSLTVTRAEVSTRAGKAVNTFYVRDTSGYPVDPKIIDSIRKTIGQTILRVKGAPEESNQESSPTRFLFGGLFKSRSFCNFGSVKSYS